jgi:hypothetical protein
MKEISKGIYPFFNGITSDAFQFGDSSHEEDNCENERGEFGRGRGLDYVMFRDSYYLEPWLRLAKHVAVASEHAARFGLCNHPLRT